MLTLANIAFRALIAWVVLTGLAQAHDIWSRAREYNDPAGFPCCGGDPMTGDCEGLSAADIWDRPDGVEIYSHRYKAKVFIPSGRIKYDVPRDVKTGQPLDTLTQYAGHWCGKPRGNTYLWKDEKQPDPDYWTFCAFINPGGS